MMMEEGERRNGFSNLLKEKLIVQQVWTGININNSWERLIVKSPHSLAAFEKLMMQSVTSTNDSECTSTKLKSTVSRLKGVDSPESSGSSVVRSSSPHKVTLNDAVRLSPASTRHKTSFAPSESGSVLYRTISTDSSKLNYAQSILDHSGRKSSNTSTTSTTSVSVPNRIINAITEARAALEAAHSSMDLIGSKTNEIPRTIAKVLSLLEQLSVQCEPDKIRDETKRLHATIDDCAQEAFILEDRFQMAIKLTDSTSAKLGRSGFMLLGDVKHFWERTVSFCGEISKLIEYTLDSSCNAFIAIILEQLDKISTKSKFRLKDRTRHEIYQISLACVAYALSVRHLTNAYSAFSNEFLLPQVNVISRYPLLGNSEIELAHAHDQFKEANMACMKEIDRVVKQNRATSKRRSILELDLGLDLHLSDISLDLDEFLTPIAEFKSQSHSKQTDSFIENKSSSVFEKFRANFTKKASL